MKSSNFRIVKKSFCLEEKSSSAKILQVHHTVYLPDNNEVKRLIFLSVVFDSECKRFACSDHRGNVFVFDLQSLKYWRLQEVSNCILTFSPCKRSYLILSKGNAPFEVLIINAENSLQKFAAVGHRYRAKMASFSMKGDLLITANKKEALVWETHRYTLCYELKIENLHIRNIAFAPISDNIFANFVNNTVQLWNKNTFQHMDKKILEEFNDVHHLSFSKDGRCIALALESSNTICIYNKINWQCIRKISLKKSNIQEINQMFFLDDENEKHSRILVIHSKDCNIFLLDLERVYFVQLFTDCEPKQFSNITVSPNGKYLACIHNSGEIDINNVGVLLGKLKDKRLLKNSLTLLNNKTEKGGGEDRDTLNNVEESEANGLVSRKKLLNILKQFNVYPEKHRFKIWKQLLQIPINNEAYCKMLAYPADTKYRNLEKFLTISNTLLLMHMKKILCLVTTVCPVLENVEYLPIQIFPFIKLLHKDPVFCFEAIVTVLKNYCQMWYNYDSHPPTDILLIIDCILEQRDVKLYRHYQKLGVSSSLYAFSLMKTLFSENFHSKEWLQLWDHILSNEPSFILMAVVAYNTINRSTLLSYKTVEQFKMFFDKRCRLFDMKSFISECYELMETTDDDLYPRQFLKPFKGLNKTRSYSEINLVDPHIGFK